MAERCWRASDEVRRAALRLRRAETPAERVLWNALRRRRLEGLLFHRQHPLRAFVLDFYCPARRLAVEVDGGVHEAADQARHDAERTAALGTLGIRVLRLSNDDVLTNLGVALHKVADAAIPVECLDTHQAIITPTTRSTSTSAADS